MSTDGKVPVEKNRRIVPAREIFLKSSRFDLIFKLMVAKAWFEGEPRMIRRAEEAYLEMLRSCNGFWEGEPLRTSPEDYIRDFRKTATSIRSNGYDLSRPAIPVDASDELLNGAHRLSICTVLGLDCAVFESDIYPAGGSVHATFVRGHIHPAVANWGMRRYLELFPEGRLADQFRALSTATEADFPNWSHRARHVLFYQIGPFLLWLRHALQLPFRWGKGRAKTLHRMDKAWRRVAGYRRLARYWEDKS